MTLFAQLFAQSRYAPADQLTAEQKAVFAESDKLLAEIIDADVIVLSLAVYNFGVPASLKAWIDQVPSIFICLYFVLVLYTSCSTRMRPFIHDSRLKCLQPCQTQIARPGIAFRYTAAGPEGLLPNKKVYVVSSSGGNLPKPRAPRRSPRTARTLSTLGFPMQS